MMKMEPKGSALWTAADAAAATRGRTTALWRAGGVSIDTRSLAPGDLFVAIRGDHFDGHAFLRQAADAGAAAACVSYVPQNAPVGLPLLVVEDTFSALRDLGHTARLRSRAQVIAVTGSVGKTSAKETLRLCLNATGKGVHATVGNLNNHLGAPLSLARMPADCAYGVFELGMNHAGEIAPLSRQVRPDVAIITNVEAAHLEFFPSVEAIADAKAEIFQGMSPNGVAILNRDNPQFGRLLAAARTQGLSRILSFGCHPDSDARLVAHSVESFASSEAGGRAPGGLATVTIAGASLTYRIGAPGRHWAINSLSVLLAIWALGGDCAVAAQALERMTPIKGRGAHRHIAFGDGVLLIDESYNASPASMRAAFEVLSQFQPKGGGRRVAILGDMRELGERSDEFHAALVEPLLSASIDVIHCCGRHMRRLHEALPMERRGLFAEDSASLASKVAAEIREGDVALVKGSAGSRMNLVIEALNALESEQGYEAECGRVEQSHKTSSAASALISSATGFATDLSNSLSAALTAAAV
ncbi:UDP-N-acetylmuramoyl-tripeptide--D-alanyl-D-alanine ligase [Azospirillaceae bacterium]